MLMGPEKIERLLPHGPRMRLIDAIVSFDDESLLAITARHLDSDNPLRRPCGLLPITTGIEFAGQVTALHGALIDRSERSTPRQGYLVMARDVAWQIERLDQLESALEISVALLNHSEQSAMYHFRIATEAHSLLMKGRIAVYFQGVST
ncbi:MAG: hypothetical protein RL333_1354 [Pseudomonadota bacterium]|jgi:predicted hotdog family 3-hydroxylacyl-ACP dehydratase